MTYHGTRRCGAESLGHRTTMQDGTGTTTYAYDAASRTTGKTDPGALSQAYAYDAAGQRTRLTDPDGGVRTYTYDADGRLTKFQDPDGSTTTQMFDALGRKTTVVAGDHKVTLAHGYDAASQIVSLSAWAGASTSRFDYAYDLNGNRTGIVDQGGPRTTYQYDAKDRLTQDHTTGSDAHTYDYAYDGNDNRTFASENGPQTFAYDAANRLTTSVDSSSVSTSYGYDTDGNLVEVAVDEELPVEMQYDEENRMIVHVESLARTTYAYDGDGLKRSETTGSDDADLGRRGLPPGEELSPCL